MTSWQQLLRGTYILINGGDQQKNYWPFEGSMGAMIVWALSSKQLFLGQVGFGNASEANPVLI